MTSQQVYATGTVSVTNGFAVFTGTGTAWDLSLLKGGIMFVAGQPTGWPIGEIVSDTAGEFVLPWPGGSVSNANYAIFLETAQSANATESNRLLLEAAKRLRGGSILGFNASGTLAERADYNTRPKDFVYLATDGPELLFYVKRSNASGDWSAGQPFRGPQGAIGPTGPAGTLNWINAGWQSGVFYGVNAGLAHLGTSYRAHTSHVSSTSTRPGVGGSWQSVWEISAAKGDQGFKGWTTKPGLVGDGNRRVLRVAGFIGGEGAPPTGEGLYVGPSGFVANVADAIDIRGEVGPQGQRGVTWRAEWNDTASYEPQDIVIDDDGSGAPAAWIAIASNTASRPRENAQDWALFPGSFPTTSDYGLITDIASLTRDYGSIA